MKKLLLTLLVLSLCGCVSNNSDNEIINSLPIKENPNSTRMSDSPLSSLNIDEYLNLDNVLYYDLREEYMIKEEGIIKGFTCFPFYSLICSIDGNSDTLFKTSVIKDENGNKIVSIFQINSFEPLYNESIEILEKYFPKDKQIVFMTSTGVESSYLMNLLIQYGWDASKLYNAGSFSNTLGNNIAYRELENKKNYLDGEEYIVPEYNFVLTKIDN